MALTPFDVYRCKAAELRQSCCEKGLDGEGPLRTLRHTVVRYLKARAMDSKKEILTVQASDPADLSAGIIHNDPQNSNVPSHACVGEGSNSVFFF
jgi:hypothetical protein